MTKKETEMPPCKGREYDRVESKHGEDKKKLEQRLHDTALVVERLKSSRRVVAIMHEQRY